MRTPCPALALPLLAALCACSGEPAGTGQATGGAAPETAPATAATPPAIIPPPTPADTPGAAAKATIPAAAQGRFGLVPADCTTTRGDDKGLITVGPTRITFYESVATLVRVTARSASAIRARFAFEGEGMEWQRDVLLDARNDGRVLILREYGADAVPGPRRYTRCA